MSDSSSSSGIFKMILVIGAAIVGMFRTCGRFADDAVDIGRHSDEFVDMGRSGGRMDDAARYTDEVIDGRRMYRNANALSSEESAIIKMGDVDANLVHTLEDGSSLKKSIQATKGMSPQMRMQMLYVEYMPASVRNVVTEPGGEEMYFLMMGKRFSEEEMYVLRELFDLKIKPSNKYDDYVYIRDVPQNYKSTDDIDELNRRAYDSHIKQKDGIKEIEFTTVETSIPHHSITNDDIERIAKRKKIIVETKIEKSTAKKLYDGGLKVVKTAKTFIRASKLFKKDFEVFIYCPSDDASFMDHYKVNLEEAQSMRRSMASLDKLNGIKLIEHISEIKKETVSSNLADAKLRVIIANTENFKGNEFMYIQETRTIRMSVQCFSLDQLNTESRGFVFQELANAFLQTKGPGTQLLNDYLDKLGLKYSELIYTKSNKSISAQVLLGAAPIDDSFGVNYFR